MPTLLHIDSSRGQNRDASLPQHLQAAPTHTQTILGGHA
jgi:hypothetical protein